MQLFASVLLLAAAASAQFAGKIGAIPSYGGIPLALKAAGPGADPYGYADKWIQADEADAASASWAILKNKARGLHPAWATAGAGAGVAGGLFADNVLLKSPAVELFGAHAHPLSRKAIVDDEYVATVADPAGRYVTLVPVSEAGSASAAAAAAAAAARSAYASPASAIIGAVPASAMHSPLFTRAFPSLHSILVNEAAAAEPGVIAARFPMSAGGYATVSAADEAAAAVDAGSALIADPSTSAAFVRQAGAFGVEPSQLAAVLRSAAAAAAPRYHQVVVAPAPGAGVAGVTPAGAYRLLDPQAARIAAAAAAAAAGSPAIGASAYLKHIVPTPF